MGNGKPGKCSLKAKEIKAYVGMTNFDAEEIKGLSIFFKAISSSEVDDNLIDRMEFQKALGFKESLYVDRIFQLFDEDGDLNITFVEFICGLSILSTKGTLEEKMSFSFQICDFDGDGKISRQELECMLKASLVESDMALTDAQTELLLNETFAQVDQNKDGFIDYNEYKSFVEANPKIISLMNVDVKKKCEKLAAMSAAAGGEEKN